MSDLKNNKSPNYDSKQIFVFTFHTNKQTQVQDWVSMFILEFDYFHVSEFAARVNNNN